MPADTDVLIVGAGHGALAVGHDLVRAGLDVLLVDAHPRVGDAWRTRWDSLRLFTPRELDALPDIPFPTGDDPFPNKDEVADYQERYAREMGFPLRLGAGVRALTRKGELFEATLGADVIRAPSVVIAGGHYDAPCIPDLATRLAPSVLQLHSSEYRRARDLPEGPVVVVGAANSGGEIAVEVARERPTTIAWLPWPLRAGGYLEADLDRAAAAHGLRLAPRAVDAAGDTLRFADGGAATARTVIWATGYRADHSWIIAGGEPPATPLIAIGRHGRAPVPGLHLVRGRFLFAISRHARDVARDVARRD